MSIDFSRYLKDRTRDFIGREWSFVALNDWLAHQDGSRMFVVTGDPGSGKTALAAHLHQINLGNVAAPGGLVRLAPGFLTASHFCSARDRRWINPQAFAESLALQLQVLPGFAEALVQKASLGRIILHSNQKVDVVTGKMIGIQINNLDLSGVAAEDAFMRAVRQPLEAVYAGTPDTQTLILVDALDEALLYSGAVNIASLLLDAQYLPRGVRFILTLRPVNEILLRLRRQRPGPEEIELSPSAAMADKDAVTTGQQNEIANDIRRYAEHALVVRPKLAEHLAKDLNRLDFARLVQERSDGNSLYAQYLLEMLEGSKKIITETTLLAVPPGLDAFYLEFLDRIVAGEQKNTSRCSVRLQSPMRICPKRNWRPLSDCRRTKCAACCSMCGNSSTWMKRSRRIGASMPCITGRSLNSSSMRHMRRISGAWPPCSTGGLQRDTSRPALTLRTPMARAIPPFTSPRPAWGGKPRIRPSGTGLRSSSWPWSIRLTFAGAALTISWDCGVTRYGRQPATAFPRASRWSRGARSDS
jgi:hypothetical protein